MGRGRSRTGQRGWLGCSVVLGKPQLIPWELRDWNDFSAVPSLWRRTFLFMHGPNSGYNLTTRRRCSLGLGSSLQPRTVKGMFTAVEEIIGVIWRSFRNFRKSGQEMVLTLGWDLEKMNVGQDPAPPRADELGGLKGQNESQSGWRVQGEKESDLKKWTWRSRAWLWKAGLRSLDFILCAEESHGKVELYKNCPHCSWRMALSRAGREAEK